MFFSVQLDKKDPKNIGGSKMECLLRNYYGGKPFRQFHVRYIYLRYTLKTIAIKAKEYLRGLMWCTELI